MKRTMSNSIGLCSFVSRNNFDLASAKSSVASTIKLAKPTSVFRGFGATSATQLLRRERTRKSKITNEAVLKKYCSESLKRQSAIEEILKKHTNSMENMDYSIVFVDFMVWLTLLVK